MLRYYGIPSGNFLPVLVFVQVPMAEKKDTDGYYEADSTPDTPLTIAEGQRLLAMIRGCEPEDFLLETEFDAIERQRRGEDEISGNLYTGNTNPS